MIQCMLGPSSYNLLPVLPIAHNVGWVFQSNLISKASIDLTYIDVHFHQVFLHDCMQKWPPWSQDQQIIINASKFILKGTFLVLFTHKYYWMRQIWHQVEWIIFEDVLLLVYLCMWRGLVAVYLLLKFMDAKPLKYKVD